MASSGKYVALLVFNATWDAGFLGSSLKLRCSLGIMGLELYRGVSGKVSKRAGAPFIKLNGNLGSIPMLCTIFVSERRCKMLRNVGLIFTVSMSLFVVLFYSAGAEVICPLVKY